MKISSKKLITICACSVFFILLGIILALIFWPRIPVIGFYNINESIQSKYVNILQDTIEENFGIIPYKNSIPFAKQFDKTKCDILFTYSGELTQSLADRLSESTLLPLKHEHLTILSDSPIPENFADLINHAKALKKSGNTPLCAALGDNPSLLDFLSLYTQTRCGSDGLSKLNSLLKSELDFSEILERSLNESISLKTLLNEIIDLKKAQIISEDSFALDTEKLLALANKKASPIFLLASSEAQKVSGFANVRKSLICDELCVLIIKNRKINKKPAVKFIETVFAPEEKSDADLLSVKYAAFEDSEKLSKTCDQIRKYLLEK